MKPSLICSTGQFVAGQWISIARGDERGILLSNWGAWGGILRLLVGLVPLVSTVVPGPYFTSKFGYLIHPIVCKFTKNELCSWGLIPNQKGKAGMKWGKYAQLFLRLFLRSQINNGGACKAQ